VNKPPSGIGGRLRPEDHPWANARGLAELAASRNMSTTALIRDSVERALREHIPIELAERAFRAACLAHVPAGLAIPTRAEGAENAAGPPLTDRVADAIEDATAEAMWWPDAKRHAEASIPIVQRDLEAKICAWLRAMCRQPPPRHDLYTLRIIAEKIERGEHMGDIG
jgi:hypothetical protein